MANQPNPTGWDIPKRYLRLRLRSLNKKIGPTDYTLGEDLRIKFNTVASVSGALTEANIVIGGLQVDSMFNIATSATPWIDQWYQYEVIIEAGYYQNYATIFRGTILEAVPNLQSADYTITIKALSGFNAATTAYSYNQAGRVPVSKIAAIIAKDNHLAFYDGLQDDSITVNDFTIQNQSLPTILREISRTAPVELYADNQRLYLKRSRIALQKSPVLSIYSQNIVGTPQPTPTGCKVKVLMQGGVQTGQNVKLYSTKYPQYEKTNFFLQTVAHSGDTCGSDWFTELELVKTGLGFGK